MKTIEQINKKREQTRKAQAKYRKSENGKKKIIEWRTSDAGRISRKKHYIKYKFKHKSQSLCRYAIKIGKLKRLPCEVCGELNTDAHHKDYDKPLDVIWLCCDHHMERHQKRI